MTISLTGQSAIVTGGARGIGESIATHLGEAGADIVIADIDMDAARATANQLEQAGITVLPVSCDITSLEETEALVETAEQEFGHIDILVNNAGIGSTGSILDLDPSEWQRVLEVNLTGAYHCTYAVAPRMVDQKTGRILNIASIAGRNISYTGSANYTASKWGIIGLTKHLAWDLGPYGITVNAICPGPTLTELSREMLAGEEIEETAAKIPLGRWAEPADQAKAVRLLASEDAEYMTGQAFVVDGGMLLGVRQEI